MRTILIATTNPGKFAEISGEFKDLPFTFVSLKEVGLDKDEVDEPFETIEENAIHKARYYGHKSGLLTIAEDTGLFIDTLDGWPGGHVKRHAPTEAERIQKIIEKLQGVPLEKRAATFRTSACVYNPTTKGYSVFTGEVAGLIAEKPYAESRPGMEHDVIFYHPPSQKLFGEMSLHEKNQVSHRGQVVVQIKIHLQKMFGFRQIIVPLAIVVKDRKMLLLKRRDSRPEFNNKWEFPGGGVDNGEEVEDCVVRECKEETGYDVKVAERIPKILTHTEDKYNYQVFLITFICPVVGGELLLSDHESAGSDWFTLDEAINADLLPLNRDIFTSNYQLLKQYVD